MAFTTWTELKAEIADWLYGRTDLTTQIPGFISLAEARFNREIRTRDMDAVATLTITDGVATVPTGYKSVRAMTLTASPYNKIYWQSADTVAEMDPNLVDTPRVYDRIGSSFVFWPPTSSTAQLRYRTTIPALGASTADNWLLLAHPDLYLYASLSAASMFLMNDERVPAWESAAAAIIEQINDQDSMEQEDGVRMLPHSVVV